MPKRKVTSKIVVKAETIGGLDVYVEPDKLPKEQNQEASSKQETVEVVKGLKLE